MKKLLLGVDKLPKVCYNKEKIREELIKIIALMKHELGLVFTGIVFEDMETAQKWLKENARNPYCYTLEPVAFYTKDGEIK